MELIQAVKSGDYSSLVPAVAIIDRQHEELFQDLLLKIDMKFKELINDDCFHSVDLKKTTTTRISKVVGTECDPVKNVDLKKTRLTRLSKAANIHDPIDITETKLSRPSRTIKKFVDTTITIEKQHLDKSLCPSELKEPLGSSTPTDPELPFGEVRSNQVEHQSTGTALSHPNEKLKTPTSNAERPVQGESVKKRIEEFEKRTQATTQSASKVPVITPVKPNHVSNITKNLSNQITRITPVKPIIYIEQNNVKLNQKVTKNAKMILRDKNTNVKAARDDNLDKHFKKPIITKNLGVSVENKIKKEMMIKTSVEDKPESLKKKPTTVKIIEQKKKKKEPESHIKKIESYNIDNVSDGALTDEEDNPSQEVPSWATREHRKAQLRVQAYVNKMKFVRPWFYSRRMKNPKVEELFSEHVKLRPRTSSAVWNH